MTDEISNNSIRSEFIFEIRYTPNPKIIDYRGKWAEEASNLMKVTQWGISENRLDVFDTNKLSHGFVSFKNAGFVLRENADYKYFEDKTIKFLRYFLEQREFGTPLNVERIGVRFRYVVPVTMQFDELVNKIFEKFLSVRPEAKKTLDAQIIDNGVPLTLKTPNGTINFVVGPMELDQLKEIIKVDDYSVPVSFFIDLDYWTRPMGKLDQANIFSIIRTFADENNQRYENLKKLVLGE